jgi:hypothetical protein
VRMAGFAEPTDEEPVRVFVSYSHDSDKHVAAVRDLWDFLRSQGIDARLDLPAAERRQEWTAWMLEQVRGARFVLVVASPEYKRRSDGLAAPDEGRGVQFEALLIREFLYRDQVAGVGRFLPVLLPGVPTECIPDFLSPAAGTHYRVSSMSVAGCEALLRVLTGQSYEVERPLGRVPALAPRVARPVAVAEFTDAVPQTGHYKPEHAARHSQVPGKSAVRRRIPRIVIPPMPAHFGPREELLTRARAALLEPSRIDACRMVGLFGMGGSGKSVLARDLARDEQIRRAFPDGIVWIELGPAPNLLARQAQLAEAFGDARAAIDLQQELARLNTLLTGAACLVILDNVWKREHLRAFELLEPKSALLVTTRNKDILDRSATIHWIGPLPEEPARQLLAAWAEHDQPILPPEAEEVARQCGGLPLALAIAGGMVADGHSWYYVGERLCRADLDKMEINLDDYREYTDLLRVLDASVCGLAEEQRDRYLELAVFDGRGDVPVEVVHRLWQQAGLGDLDIEHLIIRLARRSLLQYDNAVGTVTLHDLQYDYARHKLGDQNLLSLHAFLAATILNDWGGLDNTLPALRSSPLQAAVERYGVLHLIAHLKAGDQEEDIHRLLALNWPDPDHPARVENTWYAVHDRIGEVTAYSGDVGLAWNLAKTLTDKASAEDGPTASIGLEIRYSLVAASIASIAANIPQQLLVALVESGHWTPGQGLAYAWHIPMAEVKARTLVNLLSVLNSVTLVKPRLSMPTEIRPAKTPSTGTDAGSFQESLLQAAKIADEAVATARMIDDPSSRASILIALAPLLAEPDQVGLVNEAWEAVSAIESLYSRARALAALATNNTLPKILQDQARTAAHAIDDPSSRASIFTTLVPQLGGSARAAAVNNALDAIRKISQPEARAAALTALIPQLRNPRRTATIAEAWAAVRAIPPGRAWAKAIVALIPQLPRADRATAAYDANAGIGMISQPEVRAAALTALIPHTSRSYRTPAALEALDVIRAISQPADRAAALTALIPKLPKRHQAAAAQDALDTIGKISQPQDRAAAFTALIPQKFEDYRFTVESRALDVIRTINQPQDRAAAFTALAYRQRFERTATLTQALADARAINDARLRATTFTALASQLTQWDNPVAEWDVRRALDIALADARASRDANSRAIALAVLAKLMPEAERIAVARDAWKEAHGIDDPGHRAAVYTAIASSISGPGRTQVIDRACITAGAIQDLDLRDAGLIALVSTVPEALGRQAQGVARAIDKALMRSADLAATLASCVPGEDHPGILHRVLSAQVMDKTALWTAFSEGGSLSRVPVQKRVAVFEGAWAVTSAVDEAYSHATALLTMASEEFKRPTEMRRESYGAAAIAKVCSKTSVLTALASELPEALQDKTLSVVRAIRDANSWAQGKPVKSRSRQATQFTTLEEVLINEPAFRAAFTVLAIPRPEPYRAAALAEARAAALTIHEPDKQAVALVALIPHLPGAEHVTVLGQALTAAQSIDEIGLRAYILETVARSCLNGSIPPWEPYWRAVIETAAMRGRTALMSDLAAVSSVIFHLGGSLAIKECIQGLLDAGRWWP